MRLCKRNKSNLKYSLYREKEPTYQLDDEGEIVYEEIDGEQIPIETGYNEPKYDAPVNFKGYIQFKSGEAEARAFGVSTESYTHLLVMRKDEIPIDETSLIFDKSEPTEPYDKSADYRVVRVAPSLNFVTYLLKTIDHEENDTIEAITGLDSTSEG